MTAPDPEILGFKFPGIEKFEQGRLDDLDCVRLPELKSDWLHDNLFLGSREVSVSSLEWKELATPCTTAPYWAKPNDLDSHTPQFGYRVNPEDDFRGLIEKGIFPEKSFDQMDSPRP